ncbi:MAG: AarF/UbiB family protein [Planctomycetota bacterium]
MAPRLPDLRRTIRNIQRGQEIVAVLARFGFDDFVQALGIDELWAYGKRAIGLRAADAELQRLPQPVRLRKAMEAMGPTFIKMAQILSTRPDLIPEAWATEFAKLQSGVEAIPADEIRPHIEGLYGGNTEAYFESIEWESFAAASMAQAHKAVLKDGTPVILKVLRPGILQKLESDIEILKLLAEVAEHRLGDFGYKPTLVIEQFERQVLREVDLKLEMNSLRRMESLFVDDPRMVFPKTYADLTTSHVLCMELVDGVLLSDEQEDTFTEDERRELVAIASDAVFRQCFEFGFFHADPHPGNMFAIRPHAKAIVREGEGADSGAIKLCFIDYGMTGSMDPTTQEALADLVHGTINGDLDRVIRVVITLTDMSPKQSQSRAFRADVWEFISRFQTGSLADLEMGQLLNEFFAKIRRHKLEVPADIVYLIKAVTTIEGVGERICPSFDLVGHVRPHVESLVKRRYGFGAIRKRLERSVLGYTEMIERVPRELGSLTRMLQHEQISVQLKHQGLDKVTDELEQASRNISLALVISSLIVGGAILFLADRASGAENGVLFIAGIVSIVVALGLALFWAVSSGLRR